MQKIIKLTFGEISKYYIIAIATYTLIYLGWLKIWENNERMRIVGIDIITIIGLAIPVLCYLYVIKYCEKKEKKFWIIILFGQISYLVAEIIWNIYEVIFYMEAPFPGVSDIFYIATPLLLVLALLYRSVSREAGFISAKFLIDMLIVAATATFLSVQYLILPILINSNDSHLYIIVLSAYPISDLVLLFAFFYVLSIENKKNGYVYIPMIIGTTIFLITDTCYAYIELNSGYETGGLLNLFWSSSLMIISLSALYKAEYIKYFNELSINKIEKTSIEPVKYENRMGYVPYLMISFVIIVVIDQYQLPFITVLSTGAVILLLMLRQSLHAKENKNLYESLKIANDELKKINFINSIDAKTDFLTGLYNRRCVEDLLEKTILKSKKYGTTFSVLILDIDKFKRVNDKFGHDNGDMILTQMADILKSYTRTNEIIGRYGGEEFISILPDTDIEGAIIIAERLREKVSNKVFYVEEIELSITISIGVTEFKVNSDDDGIQIKKRADLAMYKAKKNGRNRVEAF